MRHGRIVYVLGDVHGDFSALNGFINRKIRQNKALRAVASRWRETGDDLRAIILQCGDFAYFWPGCDAHGSIRNSIGFLPGGFVPLYWVGGNHEDWDALDELGPGITEVDRGIFYCPFGSTLRLSPEITVLFAGGAESADIDYRLKEMAKGSPKIWWSQEGISEIDMERLGEVPKADWVVSHTAPNAFDVAARMGGAWSGGHFFEPSRGKLEEILVRYHPEKWYFGHFHHAMTGRIDGCDWECLNYLGSGGKAWDTVYLEWEETD